MTRRPSAPRRLFCALTALVTVWCVSCSAFEPLIAGLIGISPGMVCGSELMQMTSSAEPSVAEANAPGSQPSQATISDGQQSRDGFACICQSCTVTAPAQTAVALSASPSYRTPSFVTPSLAEITRQPLVPPPQLGTVRA